MQRITKALMFAAAIFSSGSATAKPADRQIQPTIVLVHGAFADSSSWNAVIAKLNQDGYTAFAAANPLRGVVSDAAEVSAVVRSISGPVVLVGHSYGGSVITEAANDNANIKGLVYVSAFAPEKGASALSLSSRFPGSRLADVTVPVALAGGGQDLFIQQDKFHTQFAADVSEDEARLMVATQRPVTQAALAEPSGFAAWRRLPSYMIYGSEDRNIPPEAMRFMAKRAHAAKTIVIDGGSHALMVSHPDEVTALI